MGVLSQVGSVGHDVVCNEQSIDRPCDGCIFLVVGLGKRVSVRVGWPFETRVAWQDSKLGFRVATGRGSKATRPPKS